MAAFWLGLMVYQKRLVAGFHSDPRGAYIAPQISAGFKRRTGDGTGEKMGGGQCPQYY